MAKTGGSAGRVGQTREGLPKSWLATSITTPTGREYYGGWMVSPDGEIYDIEKITGESPALHPDAALKISKKLNWQGTMRNAMGEAFSRGWSTVRLWNFGTTRQKMIQLRIVAKDPPSAMRLAKKLLDKLASYKVDIYNTRLEFAIGGDDNNLIGTWRGSTTEFMKTGSWGELL
jgi:hypothetical protein